ncbi:hypothetical protein ACH5RR_025482 [Cinchona calisaya]|uniref:Uncharacterized protein n=1 Tax=Cinchona calisaya TaxID=153742 RepID=A0ABD2YZR8_9GENT
MNFGTSQSGLDLPLWMGGDRKKGRGDEGLRSASFHLLSSLKMECFAKSPLAEKEAIMSLQSQYGAEFGAILLSSNKTPAFSS